MKRNISFYLLQNFRLSVTFIIVNFISILILPSFACWIIFLKQLIKLFLLISFNRYDAVPNFKCHLCQQPIQLFHSAYMFSYVEQRLDDPGVSGTDTIMISPGFLVLQQ